MRLLFTNAGRRTYMVQYALDLAESVLDVEVFVSDCVRDVAAFHVSPQVRTLLLPPALADRDAYSTALVAALRDNHIDLVFPLSDLDLDVLAELQPMLAAEGICAVIAPPDSIAIAWDKRKTAEFCRANQLPSPKAWFRVEDFDGSYPCIRKHIFGSGGSGFAWVREPSHMAGFVQGQDMLQQAISGREYGIDILNDLDGGFVAACVKRKLAMRAGETDRAEIIEDARLQDLAKRISAAFRHRGNLDVDVLEDAQGQLYCIDFNPRFGGGYPASHAAGMNYLHAIVQMAQGRPVSLPDHPQRLVVMKGIAIHSMPVES